jgi:hypothetical protein
MDKNDLLNNPETIKQLISLLQQLVPNQEDNDSPKPVQTGKAKTKKTNKKSQSRSSNNKFENMPEYGMHKEDASIDKVLSKHPPVARMREFDPASVVCRVCGKKEIVNPALVFEGAARYKCNRCATSAG